MSDGNYSDVLFEDGIHEEEYASGVQLHLWKRLFEFASVYNCLLYTSPSPRDS